MEPDNGKLDKFNEEQQSLAPQLKHPSPSSSSGIVIEPAEKRMRSSEFVEYDELLNELARQLKIARHPDPLVLLRAARLLIESNCLSLSAQKNQSYGTQNENAPQHMAAAHSKSALAVPRQQDDDDSEIRIQQSSKFSLNDVMLPKSLIKSATNNLGKQVKHRQQASGFSDKPQAPDSATSGGSIASLGRSVTRETRTPTSMTKDELAGVFEHAAKALKLLYLNDQRRLQNQVNESISSIQSITANPKTDPRLLATGRK